jgi:hypothetical protein
VDLLGVIAGPVGAGLICAVLARLIVPGRGQSEPRGPSGSPVPDTQTYGGQRMWWKRRARSATSRKPGEDSRPLIDVVGPPRPLAPIEACHALLPDHYWLGDGYRLEDDPAFASGAPWIACADLVIADPGSRDDAYYKSLEEDLGHAVERQLYVVGLLSQARHGGVPVARSAIGTYSWPGPFHGQLEVIDAGTSLEVVRFGGYYDPEYHWEFVWLNFHLPDGRFFRIQTGTSYDDAGFVFAWNDLPTHAVIVPAGHPFATDPALVDAALARIAAAAEEGDLRGR